MRIRKKAPKPAPTKPPLYLIGYSFSAPSEDELRIWYDSEYGGPLLLHADGQPGGMSASHGPWHARLRVDLPAQDAQFLIDPPAWDHRVVGTVTPASAKTADLSDAVLFAARLARGFTLLTQGTSFDLVTYAYLNPSDWKDRPLAYFRSHDHIEVLHVECEDANRDWFHTAGLSKFGIDELELFRPKGLSAAPAVNGLLAVSDKVLRQGHTPKVGTSIHVEVLGQMVWVLNHRTMASAGRRLVLRQIELT